MPAPAGPAKTGVTPAGPAKTGKPHFVHATEPTVPHALTSEWITNGRLFFTDPGVGDSYFAYWRDVTYQVCLGAANA